MNPLTKYIGLTVITSLGSGIITDYHPSANLWAVKLDAHIGQEWFSFEELEFT